jgi:hypothetical protein
MRKIHNVAQTVLLAMCCLSFWLLESSATFAQNNSSDSGSASGFGKLDQSAPLNGIKPEDILSQMSRKESEYKNALANYTWTQDIKEQTLDGKKVDGEYHVVYNVTFDADKHRVERVVFAPQNTLQRIIMTENDVQELEHKDAYPLTEDAISEYDLNYVGRQKVDDVETYVFDVKPKVYEKKHRRFEGRIWIDQQGLQIVVSSGKFVPQEERPGKEDLAPPFSTYREQVDGKFWFPVYTHGEGVLHFRASKDSMTEDIHVREIIKYTDYKQYGASIRIIYPSEQNGGKKPQ